MPKPRIEELEKILASKDKLVIRSNPDGSIFAVPPWYKRKFEFYNIQIEFKAQDLWVGAFWKTTGHTVDLWVCIIPCVPIHVSWGFHDPQQ